MESTNNNFSIKNGTIKGKVLSNEGKPIDKSFVIIIGDSPPHNDIAAVTNVNGEFTLDNLLSGNYTLLANAKYYESKTLNVYVKPNETSIATFSLGQKVKSVKEE
jgi:hypothetical protein